MVPHMADLKKTTIYLRAADYRRLKALAREQDRPTAELIREAVAEYTRRHGSATRPSSVGAARSGVGDISERAEELLSDMGRSG
ncbi:MAG: CopG family transcriptional regulator [Gemmatimonadales bacterium]